MLGGVTAQCSEAGVVGEPVAKAAPAAPCEHIARVGGQCEQGEQAQRLAALQVAGVAAEHARARPLCCGYATSLQAAAQ